MMTAELLIVLVQFWGGIGAIVAMSFLTIGIEWIDEDAQGAITFRPLLIPGIMVIWPLVLWRWWALATNQDRSTSPQAAPRRCHATVAIVLTIVISTTLLISASIKQTWPDHVPAILLEAGQ